MWLYPFFDLTLASNIALPELGEGRWVVSAEGPAGALPARAGAGTDPAEAGGAGDGHLECKRLTFTLMDEGPVPQDPWPDPWSEALDVEGAMRHRRVGRSHLVRFVGVADFLVDPRACAIHCRPGLDAALTSVRHLLLDQVLPRLAGQCGRLVLHASAVLHRGQAIGFLGRSGWGKSTLAASLGCSHKTLFGDDALLLALRGDAVEAVLSYAGLRLWSDGVAALFGPGAPTQEVAHYTDKKRLPGAEGAVSAKSRAPLRALFLLNDPAAEPSAAVSIRPLSGSDALMALVGNGFLLDPQDLIAVGDQLRRASTILRAGVPMFRLAYPRVYRDLDGVREAICRTIDAECASAAARVTA